MENYIFGVLGIIFSLPPLATLLPLFSEWPLCGKITLNILWSIIVGIPFTCLWSTALHKRVKVFDKKRTDKEKNKGKAGRIPWIPRWIGIFERGFFCVLIGFNIPGAAGFIGAWVGLKLATGWGAWSKGETYGRAVFFVGLLGNAMSFLYGLIPGLVINSLITSIS
jgi:hypothetical protein